MLTNYYEPFFIQELVEKPSPFPPPWNEPIFVLDDGKGVLGLFNQKHSTEMLIAAAQGTATVGVFATTETVENGTVLRRVRDNVYIKLIGKPITSPPQAETQVCTYDAQIVNRSEAEVAD